MGIKEFFFILIHFLTIFLGIFGIGPTIYFLVKIKHMPYRLFLIVKYAIILLFVTLAIKELDIIFFKASVMGRADATIGLWEICGLLMMISFCIGDLFVYYFYTHTKIIVSDTKSRFISLVSILAKDPKIWISTLLFIILVIELIFDKESTTLGLIKDYLKNK